MRTPPRLCFAIWAISLFSGSRALSADHWVGTHNTTAYNLKAVAALDRFTAYASGNAGLIIRTADAGLTWQSHPTGVAVDLNSIFFLDPNLGWAVGLSTSPGGSVFISTADGGVTWTRQTAPAGLTVALNSVYFHDAYAGWAVGASGRCARTLDGGTTWTNVAMPPASTFALYGVHFRDANNGCIVGGTSTTGYVMHSTDGGATWTNPPVQIAALPLYAVRCIDSTTIVAVGNSGTIYQTIDGGASWNVRTTPPGAFRPLKSLSVVGNTVYAAGDTVVIVSTDQGSSWTRKNTGLTSPRLLNGLAMLGSGEGWAVGDAGVVYRTWDGCDSWQFQLCGTTQNGFNVDLASVHFVNTTSGWAVGANTNPGGSLFLSTLDGGSTWTRQTPPAGLAVALNSVYFHDEKVGWAVGASGRCARTTDGGITWTNAAMPPASTFSLYSVDFRDTSNGLIVGGTTTAGYVMKSTDGGATWSNPPLQIAALPLYAVKYVDSVTVVTVGNMGTIYQSTDGGGTWAGRTAPPGALRPLKGISVVGNTVFAAGDTVVIVSTDGGTSWTRKNTGLITSRLLNGIAMANEITGWAVGDAGVIYNTTDGGNTWTYQQTPYPTRHHKAIAYTPGLAYCVGVAGITVRNSTPVIVGVEDDRASRPVRFVLDQNYPNPFNPTTTISFELSTRSEVTLVVYDLMGRVVATLLKEEKPAGRHTAMWDARGTASGVYFYRLVAKHSSENTGQKSVVTKKLILLK